MNKILQLFNTDQWIAAGDIQSELSCIFDWLVKWWNPAKKKKCPLTGSRLSGSRWKRNVETLSNNFLLVLTICVTVSSIRVLVIQLNQFKPLAFNKSKKKNTKLIGSNIVEFTGSIVHPRWSLWIRWVQKRRTGSISPCAALIGCWFHQVSSSLGLKSSAGMIPAAKLSRSFNSGAVKKWETLETIGFHPEGEHLVRIQSSSPTPGIIPNPHRMNLVFSHLNLTIFLIHPAAVDPV